MSQASKKLKILDADNKELQESKRAMSYQLESFKREITSALHERDKVSPNVALFRNLSNVILLGFEGMQRSAKEIWGIGCGI